MTATRRGGKDCDEGGRMRSEEEGREKVDNSENVRRTEWIP